MFKDLFTHIIYWVFRLVKSEKLSEFLTRLFIWVEIHLSMSLELFPGFILLLFPCCFLFILEKRWFLLFNNFLLLSRLSVELLLCFSVISNLLLEQVEVREGSLRETGLFLLTSTLGLLVALHLFSRKLGLDNLSSSRSVCLLWLFVFV